MKYRLFKEITGFEEAQEGNYVVSINRDNKIHVYEEMTGITPLKECKGHDELKKTLEKMKAQVVYVVEKKNDKLLIREHYGAVDSYLISNALLISAERDVAESYVRDYK